MEFRIITDLNEAKDIWDKLSYNETLFDTWEFRYCFYKYFNYPLKLITAFESDNQPVGVLPLQFNSEKGYLEFFGGSWMEDNKVYIKEGYQNYIPDFYAQIKEPAHMIGINSDDEYSRSLPIDDYKYQLPLTNYSSYWDYVNDKFNKKSQQTFKRKFRKIEEMNPKLIVNQLADIEKMIEYNLKTFGDDSSFHAPFRKEIYRDFLKLPFEIIQISIEINGNIEAVCLNIAYNGVMYYLNAGANNEAIPNLRSYTIMQAIEHSIKQQLKIFDALMISYNWKERWHFNKIPFNKFNFQYTEPSIV